MGYIKSKKMFFGDNSKMSNYFNVVILIYGSLQLIVIFLSIYLFFEHKLQLILLIVIYILTLKFTGTMKQYNNYFNNYQKASEFVEFRANFTNIILSTLLRMFPAFMPILNMIMNLEEENTNSKTNIGHILSEVLDYCLAMLFYSKDFMTAFQIFILVLSVLSVYLGLFLKLNLISVLFVFISILYWYISLSIISNDFRGKSDLHLTSGEILNEVFIIEDDYNRSYMHVLTKEGLIAVMKSSILKITGAKVKTEDDVPTNDEECE